MSRSRERTLAFTVAILLTGLGWQQVMIHYVDMSHVKLALFFPFLVVFGARDLSAILVSIIQWPLIATAFALGSRRWSSGLALAVIAAVYALAVLGSLVILQKT